MTFLTFKIQINRYIMCVIHTWSVVGRWGFWSDGSSLGIPFSRAVGGTVQQEAAPEHFVLLSLTDTTGGLGHLHSDHNQPPFLQCQNAQCLRQSIRTDKSTSKNSLSRYIQLRTLPMYFCISRVDRLSQIDFYKVILKNGLQRKNTDTYLWEWSLHHFQIQPEEP